jgi:hypothetical protein
MDKNESALQYCNPSLPNKAPSSTGYKLLILPAVKNYISRTSQHNQVVANKVIQSLASRPRPRSADCQSGGGVSYQIVEGWWKIEYRIKPGVVVVLGAELVNKVCHGQMCRGVQMQAKFQERMQVMLARGHAGKGHRLSYVEAQWWWRSANGKSLIVDGRMLSVWNVGGEFASPFPLDDLKVHGHVTTNKSNGRIFDGMYDFDRKPNPDNQIKMAVRNMLNEIAIWEHGKGVPYEIEYRYDDKFFK